MMQQPIRYTKSIASVHANTSTRTQTRYWIDARPGSAHPANGDFADCFRLDAARCGVVVGDIAGRGLAVGDAARALLAYARDLVVNSTLPLRSILCVLDDFFVHAFKTDDVPLATLFIAIADARDGALEYASAGHEPALLFNASTSRHHHLDPTGPLIGLDGDLRGLPFCQRRLGCEAGATLAVVTDGITEARHYIGADPQFFGSTGVARALIRAYRMQNDPARAIGAAALAHASGCVRDDATALVVRFGGDRERAR